MNPFITAGEVDKIVGFEGHHRSVDRFDIKLSFEGMIPEMKARIYEEIIRLKANFNFSIQETMGFKSELKMFKMAKEEV